MPRDAARDWSRVGLGGEPDGVIARRLGCTPQAVYQARRRLGVAAFAAPAVRCNPAAFLAEVGTRHDREVAARHGVSASQVAYHRRRVGVPAARINWDREPLGSVPDIVLARRRGVDNKVVAQARWRRGVAKWQERRCCPCGTGFVAFHLRQRFCSSRCQRYHWQLVRRLGYPPEVADLGVALRAYRSTMKGRA